MSFSNSLARFAIISKNSGSNAKYLQYYPVHKFNKMQYNEKQQHMKFQKISNPAPPQSKFNKQNTNSTHLNTNSNYLVVDDA
ncbi:hypothetical protein DDB_G0285833 [Dictyostelium discoideum AX4]|uniref:Uncharacterized protein n=1 Tax=Dictyostelium discoideum TaxID=44689 RepID=Q54MP6_DICDI|nr:hypothetical protein DDB_G0285833 [Dictyostelium discoideum AX4]EAL64538.1 hypothetical protein DDB_G0285833 [Dictyostelium discoideum AX4]|eukprot:XP_638031.1 hypothetical protein DDB_G0285833 [Dictyostelium discoideum AX4]